MSGCPCLVGIGSSSTSSITAGTTKPPLGVNPVSICLGVMSDAILLLARCVSQAFDAPRPTNPLGLTLS